MKLHVYDLAQSPIVHAADKMLLCKVHLDELYDTRSEPRDVHIRLAGQLPQTG